MKTRSLLLTYWWQAVCLGWMAMAAAGETNSAPASPSSTPTTVATNAVPASAPPAAMPAETNRLALVDTNAPAPAPTNSTPARTEWDEKLELAERQHREGALADSALLLEIILKTNAPPATQKTALFELATVMQDQEQTTKAQQVWSQFLHVYPDDPDIPDVLLRQGLLYRKMGADNMAISKFYAVMSSALKLKEDDLDRYKKLVIRAQTEIAGTYFLDAHFDEAADYYNRILKSGEGEANRAQLEAQLIRSLSYLTNHVDTIGKAQSFLSRFPNSQDVPEVPLLLASALKVMGRNSDSMQQVLLLLQSQQDNVKRDPESWAYWQRRAGNEIANQIYKEGDYPDALQIYLSLADLDKTPAWQIPVWYQVGLVYEQLQQWDKAEDTYTRISDGQKALNDTNRTPALASLVDMAKWRKDYIAWMQKAKISDFALRSSAPTNSPAPVSAAPANHSTQ